MSEKSIEIMAPVGSYETLMAAIQAGAGSVYFGVEQLNMRARSSNNFTLEDLKKITNIAHSAGVKTYLTVNTIIFDNEIDKLHAIIDAAKKAGVSAIIASDISAIQYARETGVEVHISTQVNITNFEAVKFYAQYADVIVLAREMNLGRVWEISEKIEKYQIKGPSGKLVRIEMFVHGALCMAVSGKCYLSLHEMNSSANRGSCLQTCRRAYTVTDNETGAELEIDNEYIMSPKDLKTIHFLNKVLDSGVTVLKIEGRARSAEYVYMVVQCYREAVESYLDGTFSPEKIHDWDERLKTVFNRGFWDGYYLGQRLGEWSKNYGSQATQRKMYIGKGLNYLPNIQVAEFKMEAGSLKVGDEIYVTGPTTGIVKSKVAEIRVDLQPVQETVKGEIFSIKLEEKIRRSDKLFKIIDASEARQRQ
ncbi:MAG: collagenase [Bacteroidetes bacterium GWF2_42_66]|nr:MAG: collagenase [Bacteroidetes bacterium GWA2_42_15]OFY02848.1 MAG: collagenase [Bacteroidetes bacterium GWE2_42_39]OFY44502.1 MAG: collagenase [Bacteroidetes bacterium GWF2_42_66]HBL74952.1 collagenase-like protease [Prolixibacteraceae bacterium]HCU62299.1 collagenase-like protease [Prolixibacteraceae bacterium]